MALRRLASRLPGFGGVPEDQPIEVEEKNDRLRLKPLGYADMEEMMIAQFPDVNLSVCYKHTCSDIQEVDSLGRKRSELQEFEHATFGSNVHRRSPGNSAISEDSFSESNDTSFFKKGRQSVVEVFKKQSGRWSSRASSSPSRTFKEPSKSDFKTPEVEVEGLISHLQNLQGASLGNVDELSELQKYVPRAVIYRCMRTLVQIIQDRNPEISSSDLEKEYMATIGNETEYFEKYLGNYSFHSENIESYLSPESSTYESSCILMADVSGFTKLNECFAERLGRGGVEQVSHHLNAYMSKMLDVILRHGGDIIKFAGDALIVLFSEPHSTDVLPSCIQEYSKSTQSSLRAVHCALDLMNSVGVYEASEVELSLHIAVTFGDIYALHVGGVNNEWEFLLAGEPFKQLESAIDLAKAGEVVVSSRCWTELEALCQGQLCTNGQNGEVLVLSMNSTMANGLDVDMSESPKLTRHICTLLRCYVPTCVLDKIDAGQTKYLAEHRKASVIFVNLRGLILNRKSSSDVGLPQRVLKAMQKVVFRNQGFRRQFLVDDKGSTFICVFGVPPFTHEHDAYRAVKTAMQLHVVLQRLRVEHSIGIATGNVYVGTVGSENFRKEHAVVSDTVNTAARLSGKAPVGRIYCDSRTNTFAELRCALSRRGDIKVKGKDTKIKIFEPTALNKFEKVSDFATYGRTAELLEVRRLYKNVLIGGHTRLLWIQGVAGIGKSHFIHELQRISNESETKCVYITLDSTEKLLPYNVIRQILLKVLNIKMISGSHENDKALLQQLRDIVPYKDRKWISVYHKIILMNAFEEDDEDKHHVDFKESVKQSKFFGIFKKRNRVAEACRKLLKHIHAVSPMIIFIENVRYADSESLSILYQCIMSMKSMLFIVTSRVQLGSNASFEFKCDDQLVNDLLHCNRVETMFLDGLDRDAIHRLVSERLGIMEVPSQILTEIMARSRGNPLYAIEIALALNEGRIIYIQDGMCHIHPDVSRGNLETIQLPQSLQRIVTEKLRRLSPDQELLCKLSSLFGMTADKESLSILYNQESSKPRSLSHLVSSLCSSRILSDNAVTVSFQSEEVQKACYDMLLFSQRARLHLEIAGWNETRYNLSLGVNTTSTSATEHLMGASHHYFSAVKSGVSTHDTYISALKFIHLAILRTLGVSDFKLARQLAEDGLYVRKLFVDTLRFQHLGNRDLSEFYKYSFTLEVAIAFSVESNIIFSKDMFYAFKHNPSTGSITFQRYITLLNAAMDTLLDLLVIETAFVSEPEYSSLIVSLWKSLYHSGQVSKALQLASVLMEMVFPSTPNDTDTAEVVRMQVWCWISLGKVEKARTAIQHISSITTSENPFSFIDSLCLSAFTSWMTGAFEEFYTSESLIQEQIEHLSGTNIDMFHRLKYQWMYYYAQISILNDRASDITEYHAGVTSSISSLTRGLRSHYQLYTAVNDLALLEDLTPPPGIMYYWICAAFKCQLSSTECSRITKDYWVQKNRKHALDPLSLIMRIVESEHLISSIYHLNHAEGKMVYDKVTTELEFIFQKAIQTRTFTVAVLAMIYHAKLIRAHRSSPATLKPYSDSVVIKLVLDGLKIATTQCKSIHLNIYLNAKQLYAAKYLSELIQ